MPPKFDGYTVAMCEILRDLYQSNNNKFQFRVEIRYRWIDKYPHHNVATRHNRGTRARTYIHNTLKSLEERGVIKRVDATIIKILDIPQMLVIADWRDNEKD